MFPEFEEDFKKCKRSDKMSKKGLYDTWSPQIPAQTTTFPTMPTYSPNVATNKNKINKDKKESKTKIFEKAALLASKFRGECQSTTFSICKGKNAIKFKCQNNHTFFMAVETLETLNVEGVSTK